MSRLPQWVGGLGAGLTRIAQRLEDQRRRAEAAAAETDPEELRRAERTDGSRVPHDGPYPDGRASGAPQDAPHQPANSVPAPPAYAPAVAPRPDPVAAVPWGVRVAAEAGWRLLVLAGTIWVLAKAITSIQLVVLAFVAALLITALLQPTVAWLKRRGVPRGSPRR